MLKELDGIYNPTIREKMERGIVSSLIGTKARFGWGVEGKKKFQHKPKKEILTNVEF